MKLFGKANTLFILLVCSALLLNTSCQDEECFYSYSYYEPVFMSFEEFRSSEIALEAPRELENIGRIYFYDNHIFINERNEGIHIIDNQNPSTPKQIGFLKIMGNADLAISSGILYADSYTDLLVIDINQLTSPQVVKRVEMAFDNQVFANGGYADPQHGVVVDWVEQQIVTDYTCDEYLYYQEEGIVNDFVGGDSQSPNGIGGSMARFTLSNKFLYTLNGDNLTPYAISNRRNPSKGESTYLGWGIETLFPYQNHLFVGSQRGMHIYNIDQGNAPKFVSTYEHITSCDPVAVEGHTAYVTLRTGTDCQNGVNELHAIDITNVETPELLSTYVMHNPHGLSVDRKTVFVCDGDEGLKVLDAQDVNNIYQVAGDDSINAYDAIAYRNILMLIGEDGLYQYDYRDRENIKLMSTIPTK